LPLNSHIQIFLSPAVFTSLLRLSPRKGIATSRGHMYHRYLHQRIHKLMHEPISRYDNHAIKLLRILNFLEILLTVAPVFGPNDLPSEMCLTQKLQTNLEVLVRVRPGYGVME
jgi:hypothetical protein